MTFFILKLTHTQTCSGNNFWNATTSSCQACSYGYYYAEPLGKCASCEGSCNTLCAYQAICRQCNSTQILDLTSYTCISACNSTTSVNITDSQYGITSVCRGFNYYVDPTSSSVVELGTKQFPYKSLALVFVELLNFHSNTNRTINVYLKENTTNYIDIDFNFVINMNTVNISPYSTTSSSPSKATILAGEANSPNQSNITAYFSSSTTFNILSSSELRKTQQILSNSNLSVSEITSLSLIGKVISVDRSNFIVTNITITSEFDNINSNYVFFYAVYLQNRNFNFTNVDFRTSGVLFNSFDPLNLYMYNIDIDYTKNSQGIDIQPVCNYPEAFTGGFINITNIKFYYANGTREIAQLTGPSIRYTGSAHYLVTGFYSATYALTNAAQFAVSCYNLQVCLPMLSYAQNLNFTSFYMTLPSNSNFDRENMLKTQIYLDTYRYHILTVRNFTAENVANNENPNVWLVGNTFNYNYFYSIKAVNVSTTSTVLFVRKAKFTVVQDIYYENCTAAGQYLLSVTQCDNITLSNATFVNVRGANTNVYSIIFLETYSGTNINVNGVYMYNSQLDQHNGIHASNYLSAYEPYFTLINCIFKNITMNSGSSLISTIVVKKLVLQNITISEVTQVDPKDTSNNIIKIRGMDLNTTGTFQISQISMSSSSVSLLDLSNIYNPQITGKSVTISNISYTDSVIQYDDDLIVIEGIETSSDFKITIDNITFTNITFVRSGHLAFFRQQTAQTLVVTNSYFANNSGSSVHIEAYNKNNLTLTTKMMFVNMTVLNSSGDADSSLTVSTGATISIYNSSFIGNSNLQSGAVASIDSLGTTLEVFNSVFQNNTAMKGGVFNVEDQGLIILNNCTLQNNFAVQSGVIQGSNEGYFEIYSSVISDNYAYSISVSELFLVSPMSIISNTQITNNNILTQSAILQEIKKCNLLCFLSQSFITYLLANTDQMSSLANQNCFQLISSSLSIVNATVVQNQSYLVNSFQSNFTIQDIVIMNCQTDANIMSLSSSNFVVNNLTLLNITSLDAQSLVVTAQFQTVIAMENVKYSNSSSIFISSDSSQLNMTNIEITSIALSSNLMSFSGCTNVMLANLSIYSLNLTSASVIYLALSSFNLIQNVSISNIKTTGIELISSNVTQISGLVLTNLNKGLKVTSSIVNLIVDSEISYCGNSSIVYGGAIDLIDSSSVIKHNTFNNNVAQRGGAISVRCTNYNLCTNSISQSQFASNYAIIKGGAINYENRRPDMINNTYSNNNAVYGSNIASYPVKIVESSSLNTSTVIDSVSSGVALSSNLVFAIQDFENHTIPDSSYSIKVLPVTQNSSISGYDSARTINGLATFTNLIFIYEPGAKRIQFKATSSSIDTAKNEALNVPTFNQIDVSFRFCQPGEMQISKTQCQECSPGTYSFDWNSTTCNSCMNNAICAGKANIEVNPGYWRKTTNSSTILYCNYPTACLGGYYPLNEHPVACAEGYTGYLCTQCGIVDGEKYQQVNGSQCIKCSNPMLNALKFAGMTLAAFIFLMILIVLTVRKKQENQISVLARILTNYIQLISAAMSFNVKFPITLTQIFGSVQIVGSTSDTFLSYDCLLPQAQITAFAPSVDIFKVALTGFVPLVLIGIVSIIWIFLHFVYPKWCSNLKRNIIISVICIIFLLHPTITKSSLLVFECILVDNNDKRMTLNIDYVCYSSDHLFWIACVTIPNFLVWIAGAPLLAFYILFKNRKQLEDEKIKAYMLVLYQGLKSKTFYWEFVNTIRKVLILICSVFLSTENALYKILASIVVLLAIIRVQLRLRPYKLDENNEIEQKAIYAGIITLFCGLIFSQESTNYTMFNTLAFIILLSTNCYFCMVWLFYLLICLNIKNQKFKMLLNCYAFILMRKSSLEHLQLLNSKSTVNLTQNANTPVAIKANAFAIRKGFKKKLDKPKKIKVSHFKKKTKKSNNKPRVTFKTENHLNVITVDQRSQINILDDDNSESHSTLNIVKNTFKVKSKVRNNLNSKINSSLNNTEVISNPKPKIAKSKIMIMDKKKQMKNQTSTEVWELSEY